MVLLKVHKMLTGWRPCICRPDRLLVLLKHLQTKAAEEQAWSIDDCVICVHLVLPCKTHCSIDSALANVSHCPSQQML